MDEEDGRSLAKKNGNIPFFECSAKETINVREAFETLARKVLIKIEAEAMRTDNTRIKSYTTHARTHLNICIHLHIHTLNICRVSNRDSSSGSLGTVAAIFKCQLA